MGVEWLKPGSIWFSFETVYQFQVFLDNKELSHE